MSHLLLFTASASNMPGAMSYFWVRWACNSQLWVLSEEGVSVHPPVQMVCLSVAALIGNLSFSFLWMFPCKQWHSPHDYSYWALSLSMPPNKYSSSSDRLPCFCRHGFAECLLVGSVSVALSVYIIQLNLSTVEIHILSTQNSQQNPGWN